MSKRFGFTEAPLKGLYTIERKPISDDRGFFSRFFCKEEYKELGFKDEVLQMNHTRTRNRGAVRGLHFQYPPCSETKIVTCIRGEIIDIAVDIRKDSPTFLKWYSEILTEDNHKSLYIPEGFAHGFQTLTSNCELLYLHSSYYSPESEGALNILDPRLEITWPIAITDVSDRDKKHAMIDENFKGIDVI